MKKLITLLLSCVLVFAVTGCSCGEDDGPDNSSHLPEIPDGVVLPDVAKGDVISTLSGFSQKYANSENMYLDYYMSYTNGESTGNARYEGKIYGDNAVNGNYKDALGDMGLDLYEQISAGGTMTESHKTLTIKLRGESCFVVSDGTLTGMYTEGYHDSVSPMDYMARVAECNSFTVELNNIVQHMQDSDKYTAEVKADDKKLYASICFTDDTYAPVYIFYLDTAAGYSKNDFGNGAPTSLQTSDILYYTADRSSFLNDFLDNKAIRLYPYGYGDVENLSGSTSLTVNYIYDGKRGNVNLNIGLSGGELYIPENSFEVICNKIDSRNFDLEKLTMFYFEIKIDYESANKTCESIIFIDY